MPLASPSQGVRRRELAVFFGGAMLLARAIRAEQKPMPIIGLLIPASPGPLLEPFLASFRQGLADAGYTEGRNVLIEYRWAEGQYDRLPALAAELVSRNVDVIAAIGGSPAAVAAKKATTTIPIVFSLGIDPVAAGLLRASPGQAAT